MWYSNISLKYLKNYKSLSMNKEIDSLGTVFGKGLGKSAFQERGNKRVLSLKIPEELPCITPIPIPLSGLVRHQDRPSDHLEGPVRGLGGHRSLDHRAGTVSQRGGDINVPEDRHERPGRQLLGLAWGLLTVRALEVPSLCASPGHQARFPVRIFLLPRCLDRGSNNLQDQNQLSGIKDQELESYLTTATRRKSHTQRQRGSCQWSR